ncbi:MAG TPA: hypothetical protein VJM84_04100 [Actinomycetota bacterium]|nr:hypothetical protein [Actinomycetota bacterium]
MIETSRRNLAPAAKGTRPGSRWLVLLAALWLSGCAASSTSGPPPTGPYPSVTAIVQFTAEGAELELIGAGVSPFDLAEVSVPLAREVFGSASTRDAFPTAPSTAADSDPPLVTTTVRVVLPEEGTQLSLDGNAIEELLRSMKTRSLAVWACTNDDRSILVTTQAPGAVSSDAISGTCEVAGTSIAKDGVTWTATVDVGPVTGRSVWPIAIGVIVLLIAIGGVVLLVRSRSTHPAA